MSHVLRIAGIVVALCAVTAFGAGAAGRTPLRNDPLSTRSFDGRTSASLQSNGADTEGASSYTITWRRPRESKSITFSSIIQQPLELRVTPAGDRAVFIGWASGSGVYAFDVVDLAAGKLLMEVPCYQPAVSPSGRSIAFVQWFAPHLTNMARQSATYRIAEIARVRQSPTHGLMQKFVGSAVYPTSPLTIPLNSTSTNAAKIHMMVGKFRWTGDSHVAFDDLYQNHAQTVRVTIGTAGQYSVSFTAR